MPQGVKLTFTKNYFETLNFNNKDIEKNTHTKKAKKKNKKQNKTISVLTHCLLGRWVIAVHKLEGVNC